MRFAVLLVGLLGVASAALLARQGLAAGLSPLELSAWRLAVASLVLLAYQPFAPRVRLSRRDFWLSGLAGLFLAAHFATWIASLQYVSIARSTLLVATSPLWAGLAGLFFPALRPRPVFWAGLAVAAVGTWLVTSQGSADAAHHDREWLGDLLATLGAICIVPYLFIFQGIQKRAGTLRTVTAIYSAAAVVLLLCLAPTHDSAFPHTAQAWISIAGMAIFAQLIGHSALNWSLQRFTAAQVAASTLLEPVFAAGLGWVFLAEKVTAVQAFGGAVLLVGVGLNLRPR